MCVDGRHLVSLVAFVATALAQEKVDPLDPTSALGCRLLPYITNVTKTDPSGRICWDSITVTSCWGRCDSNEVPDWRFPYKRSFHPVCIYAERKVKEVELRYCEEGVEPGTSNFHFYEALSCKCEICKSSEASCEGRKSRVVMAGPSAWPQVKLVPSL